MSLEPGLPRPLVPFVGFSSVLRRHGFAVAPDQTESFIASVGLLGPRGVRDVFAAAQATLAPPPGRREEFEALFRAHFLGQSLAAPAAEIDEDRAFEPQDDGAALIEPEEINEAGETASGAEALSGRSFGEMGDTAALAAFRRAAPALLPRRRSRRMGAAHGGPRPDLRRALRQAVQRDGEVLQLPRLAPRAVQRRVLLLIDVSGSMKGETDRSLRLAHALVRGAARCEAFTIGTRLTRVTRPLRHRHEATALEAASAAVPDWDGGTRLGDALAVFLSIPRYAGFARSAFVIVLSDGLERGSAEALVAATRRLSRLAWRVLWLSPLAQAGAVPQTDAMVALSPFVSRIGEGATTRAIAREILTYGSGP